MFFRLLVLQAQFIGSQREVMLGFNTLALPTDGPFIQLLLQRYNNYNFISKYFI